MTSGTGPVAAIRRPKPGRKLSQSEFNAIAAAHARFVYRQSGGLRAHLALSDLQGLELSRLQLREATLSGADLSGARLVATELERADLNSAILCDCDLQYANLKGADLRGASLRGANLAFTVLDGADLRAAIMFRHGPEGEFARSIPATADNSNGGVDFSNCSMKGTSLNDVKLKSANFHNALLMGVTFKRAVVTDARLDGAVITQVNTADLPFSREDLKQCILDPSAEVLSRLPAMLETLRVHELWVKSGGRQGAPADFAQLDIRPLKKDVHGRALTALAAREVLAVGLDFSNSQLQGANFERADLRDANFTGADLRGASFRGAKLAHARFGEADISPLALVGDRTKPVDFTGAEYSGNQFDGAVGSETCLR